MSEKKQGTTFSMHEKMINRYGEVLYHKHNKDHSEYRMHYRTHPVQLSNGINEEFEKNNSTGLIRAKKLRKMRKRADSGAFH